MQPYTNYILLETNKNLLHVYNYGQELCSNFSGKWRIGAALLVAKRYPISYLHHVILYNEDLLYNFELESIYSIKFTEWDLYEWF